MTLRQRQIHRNRTTILDVAKKRVVERRSIAETVLDSLKTAGEILRVAQSRRDVLEFTVRIFLRLGFDRVRVWLVDEARHEFYGGKASYIPDREFRRVRGSTTLKKASPYFAARVASGPFVDRVNPLMRTLLHDTTARETWEFPLLAGERLLGFIGVDNALTHRRLEEATLGARVLPFVHHVALTLHRVIAEEELKTANRELTKKITAATRELEKKNLALAELAAHDELTKLPNRRDFEARLARDFAEAGPRHPLALAMIDIDFFKAVNDTNGHLIGDRLIARVAEILQKSRVPYVARFAGDEFVALFPRTTAATAARSIDRCRKKIERETNQHVSAGVAAYPTADIRAPLDLIRVADDALYHAKHTGRNRVVAADDPKERVVSMSERKQALRTIEARGTTASDYIRKLEVLSEISEKLQSVQPTATLIRQVAETLAERFHFPRLRFYLADEGTRELVCVYAINVAREMWTTLVRGLADTQSGLSVAAYTARTVLNATDAQKDPRCNPRTSRLLDSKAALAIPLLTKKNRPLGVIVADYDPTTTRYTATDERFFLSLGRHVALALEETRLFHEIRGLNTNLQKRINDATDRLTRYSKSLETQIADNKKLRDDERRTHYEMVSALIAGMESKDGYTRGHSARVANYAYQVGRALGLPPARLSNLRYGALLHDVGKLAVDAQILNKRTALTDEELGVLSRHPVIGYRIVSSCHFLKDAAGFIRHHHERWDGTGYPDRLKGEEIPLEARIINLVDSFDAMVTRRSYGREMRIDEALVEFQLGSGKQFDPKLVKLFTKFLADGTVKLQPQK